MRRGPDRSFAAGTLWVDERVGPRSFASLLEFEMQIGIGRNPKPVPHGGRARLPLAQGGACSCGTIISPW